MKSSNLAGTINVKFVIDSTGNVAVASVGSSTMNNKRVEDGLVAAVKTWRFPTPKGSGLIKVTYPFIFSTGE